MSLRWLNPLQLLDALPNDGEPGVLFGDYHLQSGSPAIDMGTDLSGIHPALEVDFDGDARATDVGADE